MLQRQLKIKSNKTNKLSYYVMNGNFMHSILTNRERKIFELLIDNKSTEEIAYILNVTPKTVRNHISNVIQKLGVRGRAHAVVELIRLNEITL